MHVRWRFVCPSYIQVWPRYISEASSAGCVCACACVYFACVIVTMQVFISLVVSLFDFLWTGVSALLTSSSY